MAELVLGQSSVFFGSLHRLVRFHGRISMGVPSGTAW